MFRCLPCTVITVQIAKRPEEIVLVFPTHFQAVFCGHIHIDALDESDVHLASVQAVPLSVLLAINENPLVIEQQIGHPLMIDPSFDNLGIWLVLLLHQKSYIFFNHSFTLLN